MRESAEPETIIIGMIKAAQGGDHKAMETMLISAQEKGVGPVDILGAALGIITGLLFVLDQEGFPADKFLQNVALSILTEET